MKQHLVTLSLILVVFFCLGGTRPTAQKSNYGPTQQPAAFDYELIANSYSRLSGDVKDAMRQGWQPIGGVTESKIENKDAFGEKQIQYIQTMVRYKQ